jgi:heparosan-N-sulfate-glucuronate 5-epimerase
MRPRFGGVRGALIIASAGVTLALGVVGVVAGMLALRERALPALADVSGVYDPEGPYVGVIGGPGIVHPPRVVLGQNGIPLALYEGIGYHVNPVTVEQYGLWAYGLYTHDRGAAYRRIALRVADWLVTNQTDGRWLYDFDWAWNGVAVAKPWSSALAQAQAMSLLVRAYGLTGKERYRAAAVRALAPLQVRTRDGGLKHCFEGDCARPFFEEYPTIPPSHVLNGFMFTLVGLYDLASIAPRSPALAMYRAGRRTLTTVLPLYDNDGFASYDLTHLTVAGRKAGIASAGYQAAHINLLHTLDSLEPDPRFRHYAARWEASYSARARNDALRVVLGGVLVFALGLVSLWVLARSRRRRAREEGAATVVPSCRSSAAT